MAKRAGVNKSQAIRDALKANPDKTPMEIAELLASQHVRVSPTYISNIKSTDKSARKARRAGKKMGRNGRKRMGNGAVAESPIMAALNFVRSAGSLDAAKQALETVEEIGKTVR
jgi:hypothetical protein